MLGKICVVCLMFISGISYAQDVVRKFYDAGGRRVEEPESFYFEFNKETFADGDTLRSFYTLTGNPRSVAIVNKHGIKHGSLVMYHENGVVKARGNYDSGIPTG